LLFFFFSGLHPWQMEVPRLGVELELQLQAYTTATSMPDPNCVCDLYHSSWQCQILNPFNEARYWTCNLMVPSQICFCCATMGTPAKILLRIFSPPFSGILACNFQFLREWTVFFNKWCWENWTATCKRIQQECLTPHTQIDGKCIQDLNVRHVTIKPPEKNIGKKLLVIDLSYSFLNVTCKTKASKAQINK